MVACSILDDKMQFRKACALRVDSNGIINTASQFPSQAPVSDLELNPNGGMVVYLLTPFIHPAYGTFNIRTIGITDDGQVEFEKILVAPGVNTFAERLKTRGSSENCFLSTIASCRGHLWKKTKDSGWLVAGYWHWNCKPNAGNAVPGVIWILQINKAGSVIQETIFEDFLEPLTDAFSITADGGYLVGITDESRKEYPYNRYWLIRKSPSLLD